ncbi:MAG: succinylglutamate desuccinylase/aspartoacylase family protein [Nitrospinae bacterium]|nr:succinylglutamate desuccinylase/aspartoacylase family protein [Nitrospinota bacterium]
MKEKIFSIQPPMGEAVSLYKNVWEKGHFVDTLSIVAGLHGDHLNGLHLVSLLSRFLQDVEDGRLPGFRIAGKIQLFPMVNIQAVMEGERLWSFDNLDLDLAFPGSSCGELADRLCNVLYKHTADSNYALLLDASEKRCVSIPHIQLLQPDRSLRRAARYLAGEIPGGGPDRFPGLGIVRELQPTPAFQLRLYNQWIENNVCALVLAGGRSAGIDPETNGALLANVVNFMLAVGVLAHATRKAEKGEARFYSLENERRVSASHPGLFLPEARVGESLRQGRKLGELRDIYSGETLEELFAPQDGLLLTLRDYPLVYQNETVATLLVEKERRWYWPFS